MWYIWVSLGHLPPPPPQLQRIWGKWVLASTLKVRTPNSRDSPKIKEKLCNRCWETPRIWHTVHYIRPHIESELKGTRWEAERPVRWLVHAYKETWWSPELQITEKAVIEAEMNNHIWETIWKEKSKLGDLLHKREMREQEVLKFSGLNNWVDIGTST